MGTLLEPLHNKYKLDPVGSLPGWYQYVSITPAHRFTMFVKCFKTYALDISVRDTFDISHATFYMAYLDNYLGHMQLPDAPAVVKSDIKDPDNQRFDAMVLLGPAYHDIYRWVDSRLNAQMWIAFPAFHCEFSGDETPDLARTLMNDYVCTIDWQREPSPRILMNSENPKTQTSTGGEFELVRLNTLLIEIDMLHGAGGGFIDVRNIWGEQCRITPVDERFDLRSDLRAAEHGLSKERLVELVRQFLVHGWGDKRSCVPENGC